MLRGSLGLFRYHGCVLDELPEGHMTRPPVATGEGDEGVC
jgi:hypothetical protein